MIQDALSNLKGLTSEVREEVILREDEFKIISDWYHFAILSLAELKKNKSECKWISKRLNITESTTKDALGRLLRLNLIKIQEGRLIATGVSFSTTSGISSDSIKKNHQQILSLAHKKLDEVSLNLREYSSIVFAIQTSKIPEAKKLIKDFKIRLTNLLENPESSDEVYACAIQLFPLTSLNH